MGSVRIRADRPLVATPGDPAPYVGRCGMRAGPENPTTWDPRDLGS